MAATQETIATGRRKRAIARVRLAEGSGKITINGRSLENYFPVDSMRGDVEKPLEITESRKRFDIRVNVCGGGACGQAGAVRHGIARALQSYDSEMRPVLKKEGLLTRDPRKKERKKYGQPGARKRFQYSKR